MFIYLFQTGHARISPNAIGSKRDVTRESTLAYEQKQKHCVTGFTQLLIKFQRFVTCCHYCAKFEDKIEYWMWRCCQKKSEGECFFIKISDITTARDWYRSDCSWSFVLQWPSNVMIKSTNTVILFEKTNVRHQISDTVWSTHITVRNLITVKRGNMSAELSQTLTSKSDKRKNSTMINTRGLDFSRYLKPQKYQNSLRPNILINKLKYVAIFCCGILLT